MPRPKPEPRKPPAPRGPEPAGLTRRGLFRSLGTATLVAGCVTQESPKRPDQGAAALAGADGAFGLEPAPLKLTLDGQPIERAVEARTTLLELLRLDLDQTGAKLVCDRGACGACMVLVDGVARNACMLLAHDVAGAEIRTVAGLAAAGELSPLQQAFIDHDALQCGFCTSGMLVSATALLEGRAAAGAAKLDREQVADALAGNLCRCGTYPHIIDAVLAVANAEAGRRSSELIQVRAARKGGA